MKKHRNDRPFLVNLLLSPHGVAIIIFIITSILLALGGLGVIDLTLYRR